MDKTKDGFDTYEKYVGSPLIIPIVKIGDNKKDFSLPPDPNTEIPYVVDEGNCYCPCSCEDYYRGLNGWSTCK